MVAMRRTQRSSKKGLSSPPRATLEASPAEQRLQQGAEPLSPGHEDVPKILIVGTQGQRVTSGPGTFMRYVIEAIDRKELNADVLYTHGAHGTPYADKDFVHCLEFASFFHRRFYGSWLLSSLYLFWVLRILRRHKRYSKIWFAERFSSLFCVLSRPLREKSIVMVNDDTRILKHRRCEHLGILRARRLDCWLALIFYTFERIICRHNAIVIACSNYLRDLLRKEYDLGTKVARVYKGVDLTAFPRRESEPCEGSVISILFLKNEWYRGGLDTLIDAISTIRSKELKLMLVGVSDSDEIATIERLITDAGLTAGIDFRGLVDRQEISSILRRTDILCVPSRSEALGVAFLESLATGTPVVASNVGGIPEVLDQGRAGWMVPPEDPVALSKALMEVIQDTALRREKQKRGYQHVAAFSIEEMIKSMREVSCR